MRHVNTMLPKRNNKGVHSTPGFVSVRCYQGDIACVDVDTDALAPARGDVTMNVCARSSCMQQGKPDYVSGALGCICRDELLDKHAKTSALSRNPTDVSIGAQTTYCGI